MEYSASVRNGAIVLDEPHALPDGTRVTVIFNEKPLPPLAERLKNVIGKAVGLPPDMAENHDHYLHGLPKRSPE